MRSTRQVSFGSVRAKIGRVLKSSFGGPQTFRGVIAHDGIQSIVRTDQLAKRNVK
jgi:hypothetical protein